MVWMAIFQTQGQEEGPLQLELEGLGLSFLFEQEKIPAFQCDSVSWGFYEGFAKELKADWFSFLAFKEERAYEEWLAGEESRGPCWTVGRDWLPEGFSDSD